MEKTNSKTPKKGGGGRLKKLFEEKRKNAKPNPELLKILEQQKINEEKEIDKKSALVNDHPSRLDV